MLKNRTLIVILFLIGACGGGGGGSSPTPTVSVDPTPPTPPAEPSFQELKADFESYYEYRNHWGLESINSSSAYARGATGSGITIGIADSGLDPTHPEIEETRLSPNSDLEYDSYKPNTRQKRHGTYVTSIAAGGLDRSAKSPMHGVAFDADVLFVAIQLAEPDDDYDPVDLGGTDGDGDVTPEQDFTGIDSFFSQLFNFYNFYDVDIVNNSYGFPGNVIDYTETQVRNAFPLTIAEMSQIGTADADKTIYVWAAGNAGGYVDQGVDYSSPELLAGMAHFIPEIQGHSIAVVSIDDDGQISDFSNRCGVAQDYCIAAPGGSVNLAYPTSADDTGFLPNDVNDPDYDDCVVDNSCYANGGGTSFAAPFVSGGLAVIAGHFEGQLGNTEIVSRLFATANKDGVYADKDIYGQGLMDLDAATAPVGQMSAMLSQNLYGPMTSAESTTINLTNPAFGDALSRSIGNQTVIFFDELHAPFRHSLNGLVSDYRNQVRNLHGYDEMLDLSSQTQTTNDTFFEVGFANFSNHSNELVVPDHLLKTKTENKEYFAYFNHDKNTFMSQGINAAWTLGIFQDHELRNKNQLRYKFNNPWLNFTASGTSFGSIKELSSSFDMAFALSNGRNKFQSNEIFGERNSSTVALIELQPKRALPSLQMGLLKENDSSNGLSGSGALNGSDNQLTRFIGLTGSTRIFGGKFFSSMYLGQAEDSLNDSGMIQSITKLRSSSFGIGFLRQSIFGLNDQITFTVNQPIRIESGNIAIDVPYYRTKEKEVLFNSLNLNLKPSGREINTKVEYGSSYKQLGYGVALGYKSDPYHMKNMDDYWYLSLGFKIEI